MKGFLDPEPQFSNPKTSKFFILPVPFEATTSYGKGTKNGPQAILNASQQIEEFDEELHIETYKKVGIHTLKPLKLSSIKQLDKIYKEVWKIVKARKVPVILGGEHSITPLAVKACASVHKDLTVLQFDAHADLRDEYQGSKQSHACPMRRILEICPAVQVGIRNISREGYEFAQDTGQIKKIHWAEKIELVDQIETQLSKNVYITIDVDVFDPSIVPAVGTPEPGGMFWQDVLDILKKVCQNRNIVGFDVVELSPRPGDIVSDFTIAKLVYKIMGYIAAK